MNFTSFFSPFSSAVPVSLMTFLLDNSPLDAKMVDRSCCYSVGASSLTLGWGRQGWTCSSPYRGSRVGLTRGKHGGLVLGWTELFSSPPQSLFTWHGYLEQYSFVPSEHGFWNSTRLCLQPLPLFWMSKSRGGRKKERVLGSDKCFPFLSVSLQNGRIPKHLMTPEHKCFYYYCVWPQAILGEQFCSGRYPLKKQQQNVIKGPQIN